MKFSIKKLLAMATIALTLTLPALAAAQSDQAPGPSTPSVSCTQLTAYLVLGSTDAQTNGQVTLLQKFLVAEGYLNIANTTGGFGTFGGYTSSAVQAFQKANGLAATGSVGADSRARIQTLSCGNSTATTQASVSVVGTPTLSLTYSTAHKESQLTATFEVSVTAGNAALTIGPNAFGFLATDGNSAHAVYDFVATDQINSSSASGGYVLPAGQTQTFSLIANFNPQIMFAGNYHVSFDHVNLDTGLLQNYFYLVPPANSTNAITIVGELSPYITSITSPVTVGGTVTIKGTHFPHTALVEIGKLLFADPNASTDGTSDFFVPQTNVPGSYPVQLQTANGNSNIVYLQINPATSTITQTPPTTGVSVQISPNSPTARTIVTDQNNPTKGVVLGIFRLSSTNQPAIINSLTFGLKSSSSDSVSTYLSNIRLVVGGTIYTPTSVSDTGVTFNNLSLNLAEPNDLTVSADVGPATTNVSVTASLRVGSSNTVTASPVTFRLGGLLVYGQTVTYTPSLNRNGTISGGSVVFGIYITNQNNTDVYLSKIPAIALSTSSAGSAGSPAAASSTITFVTTSPNSLAEDTSNAFVIPAGSSRTFTYTGSLDNTNGINGLRIFKITAINYGGSPTDLTSSSVTSGVDTLVEDVVLNGSTVVSSQRASVIDAINSLFQQLRSL